MSSAAANETPKATTPNLIMEVNRPPFGIAVRLRGDEKKRFFYAPTPDGVSIGNVTMEIAKSASREGVKVDTAELYKELLPLVRKQ